MQCTCASGVMDAAKRTCPGSNNPKDMGGGAMQRTRAGHVEEGGDSHTSARPEALFWAVAPRGLGSAEGGGNRRDYRTATARDREHGRQHSIWDGPVAGVPPTKRSGVAQAIVQPPLV